MPMGFVLVCVLLPVSWLLRTFEQWFMCVCVCVFCSSSMKRLPFSDDEFVSPPNKMAREEEPKKGTRYVCTLLGSFDGSHGEVFEWRFPQGLNRCVHMHVHVCVCLLWLTPWRQPHSLFLWAMWLYEVFQNIHTWPMPPLTQQNTTDQWVHTCKQACALYPISYS